mmetsp:Transcript_11141/g.33233  ORF Transcript_11141/g.33233 Transcript_11141/m.33233 type:complete len:554 (-) Transcript_11141:9-1670(-)
MYLLLQLVTYMARVGCLFLSLFLSAMRSVLSDPDEQRYLEQRQTVLHPNIPVTVTREEVIEVVVLGMVFMFVFCCVVEFGSALIEPHIPEGIIIPWWARGGWQTFWSRVLVNTFFVPCQVASLLGSGVFFINHAMPALARSTWACLGFQLFGCFVGAVYYVYQGRLEVMPIHINNFISMHTIVIVCASVIMFYNVTIPALIAFLGPIAESLYSRVPDPDFSGKNWNLELFYLASVSFLLFCPGRRRGCWTPCFCSTLRRGPRSLWTFVHKWPVNCVMVPVNCLLALKARYSRREARAPDGGLIVIESDKQATSRRRSFYMAVVILDVVLGLAIYMADICFIHVVAALFVQIALTSYPRDRVVKVSPPAAPPADALSRILGVMQYEGAVLAHLDASSIASLEACSRCLYEGLDGWSADSASEMAAWRALAFRYEMGAAAQRPAGVSWKRVLRRLEGLPACDRTPENALALAAEDVVWPRPLRGLAYVFVAFAIFYTCVPFVMIRNARGCSAWWFTETYTEFGEKLDLSTSCYLNMKARSFSGAPKTGGIYVRVK